MFVLCAHHVLPGPPVNARHAQFVISPAGLRRVIRSARRAGLHFISLTEALRFPPEPDDSSHRRNVVLTFDDGYVNNLTHALPVLQEEACPATIFAVAGKLGGTNDWDPDLPAAPLMTLDQMRKAAHSADITFGSHGWHHRRLGPLTAEELGPELHTSHRTLAEALGPAYVPALAYPYGNYSAPLLSEMPGTGYRAAFTIRRGQWMSTTSVWEIPRYCLGWSDGQPGIFLLKCLRNRLLGGSS